MEMKLKLVTIIVSVNLAALVLLAIFMPHLMISPGALISAHAELTTDCFACHTPFIGSTPEKCIACHKVEEIGLKTTTGFPVGRESKNVAFHQKLNEEDCVACHSDHKGVKSFRPISRFSHNLLDDVLQQECDSCHRNPGDSLHRKIKGNCKECHTQKEWTPATFDHNEYFRFDRHHDANCESCHVENDYSNYTCYSCHEHSKSNVRREHLEEGIREYENCVECHRSGDEHEAERIWKSKRNRTSKSGSLKGYKRERKERYYDDDD